ncbi:MAG: thermonuclease family protein [Mesorhizobium sp.]|nr:MAG: thermonuclease family protein [Mesorhizobium sp.]
MEPEDDLKSRIEAALVRGRLSQWQRQFLNDMHDRFAKYGARTRLSDKQWAKLYEIIGRPAAPSAHYEPSRSLPHRPAPPQQWRPRRPRNLLEREARFFARRFTRTFGMALALIVVGLVFSLIDKGGQLTWPNMPSLARSGTGDRVPLARSQFTITDGDTIRLDGTPKGTRLVGFNAPESIEPRCAIEADLGRRAKARLTELVSSAKLELQVIPCSCPPGTEGTDKCNYGRSCGHLFANGQDVGDVLISEGLAVPFVCGSTSCPPTPRPWCNS